MEKKWRVSHVELLEGGLLFGFVLYDEKGRPCVSFGYADDKKAECGPQSSCGSAEGRRASSRSLSCEAK